MAISSDHFAKYYKEDFMALDTPVKLGASGKGGARPGSGAKKGQHRIASGDLRKAIEAKLGMSYTEMLAETQLKLFLDFKQDKHVKEFIRFTENMSNRILENQAQQVELSTVETMTDDELKARALELITQNKLENLEGNNGENKAD